METHSGCDVNGGTEHRTLDVDWLISCTSGKSTLQPPWEEDNGLTVICETTQSFGRHALMRATQIPSSACDNSELKVSIVVPPLQSRRGQGGETCIKSYMFMCVSWRDLL